MTRDYGVDGSKVAGQRSKPASSHPGDRFAGKRVVVTGAAGGIGLGIAQAFWGHGARVASLDANGELLRDVTAVGQLSVVADVSDADSVRAAITQIVDAWGSIDIVVNCAGVSTPHVVADLTAEAWRKVIDVNLTGTFLVSAAALPWMREQRYGKIVNIASVAGKRISFNGSAAYTASKAGVLGLTRHLAYEVASQGINVNAVCPGPVLTPLMESLADEDVLAARKKAVPLGRLNSIGDCVSAVTFLASDEAEGICGVALDVDGGSLLGWNDVDVYFGRRQELTARFDGREPSR